MKQKTLFQGEWSEIPLINLCYSILYLHLTRLISSKVSNNVYDISPNEQIQTLYFRNNFKSHQKTFCPFAFKHSCCSWLVSGQLYKQLSFKVDLKKEDKETLTKKEEKNTNLDLWPKLLGGKVCSAQLPFKEIIKILEMP